jgi:hypothetical protein
MISGQLAKTKPEAMGYGRLPRGHQQCSEGQGDWWFGCETREGPQYCQVHKRGGGQEEN